MFNKALRILLYGAIALLGSVLLTAVIIVFIVLLPSPEGGGVSEQPPTVAVIDADIGEPDFDEAPGGASDAADTELEDVEPEPQRFVAAEVPQVSSELSAVIDTIAGRHGAVAVQVAVINNGEVTGAYFYGDAIINQVPVSADTKFLTASISKLILGMIIMRLVELGDLDLDADISEYWGMPIRNPNHPDIPITIRQMLSHTSSLLALEYGYAADGELVMRRLADGSAFGRSTPGNFGSFNYNNYAFSVLGLTVEMAMNETVNSLSSRYLFEPLAIDAAFGSGSIEDTDNIAELYRFGGAIGLSAQAQSYIYGSTFPGECGVEFAGGLTISANELARLIAALANGGEYGGVRMLSPESVALIESSHGHVSGFDQGLPIRRRVNLFGEEEIFYHTGSLYGVFSLASYNPTNRNGVVVLTTGTNGVRDANGISVVSAEISDAVYEHLRQTDAHMRRFAFVDAHADTISRALLPRHNVGLFQNQLHIDFERLSTFDSPVQVFAAWCADGFVADAFNRTNLMFDFFEREAAQHGDIIEIALDLDDLERIAEAGKAGAILGIEGGEALMGEIENLNHFFNRGVRIMGLTWNRENELGFGQAAGSESGLKPFGFEVIERMEELGMIMDVSHLNEAGFWDAVNHSTRPFMASHSNAHAVTPHRRNLTNEQILAVVERGGIIGIAFYSEFLTNDASASIDDIVRHITHFIELGAVNHIGLGSDFDGMSDLPAGMTDVTSLRALENRLVSEFGNEIASKIMSENFYDFFVRYFR